MTDKEKAIVMAYTGRCMLAGNKLDVFYKYLAEKFGRPIYSHELPALANDIEAASREDFIALCREEKDVVEVVRCKDCKYSVETDKYERWCYGFCQPARLVRSDDYCSHGKKEKTDG